MIKNNIVIDKHKYNNCLFYILLFDNLNSLAQYPTHL